MLTAAVVIVCMGAQGCSQYGGNITKSWCGKTAVLERPASMGGNASISVRCSGGRKR